ncbi:MAG TPA: ABC transporter permease [Planctomycetota bacterium]|nr:ABC transporter permease [Planctomycetota bacterium]
MKSDRGFVAALSALGGVYVVLIVALPLALLVTLVASDPAAGETSEFKGALFSREVRFAVGLTLWTSTLSALLSLVVGIPLGYVLSRTSFPGRGLVDVLIEIPIVLPPLVVGLGLLILFEMPGLKALGITYRVPAVVLAQAAVAAAFAVRTMKVTFDQISPRTEQVARTLGCSRAGAFFRVSLPEARRGVLTAGTLAWARSIGEFGPVLVFAGATRGKTEVLATTIWLELSIGRLEAAAAVSLVMVLLAVGVLLVVRRLGTEAAL